MVIHFEDIEEIFTAKGRFAIDNEDEIITETKYVSNHILNNVNLHNIRFDEINIVYGDVFVHNPLNILFDKDYESIELNFTLQGASVAKRNGVKHTDEIYAGSHNIMYINDCKGAVMIAPNTSHKIFEVIVSTNFFEKCREFDNGQQFFNNIDRQQYSCLGSQQGTISPKMKANIWDIMNCKYAGGLKKMYIEAKVMELLTLQWDELTSGIKQNSSLKRQDIEKIYAAKEIIEKNMFEPCSLLDLAKKVGTNEFTLKKGFREILGTTVFGYLGMLRMDQARQLLIEDELMIYEAAFIAGYKNPNHFSTAFKRRYGVSPGILKHKK